MDYAGHHCVEEFMKVLVETGQLHPDQQPQTQIDKEDYPGTRGKKKNKRKRSQQKKIFEHEKKSDPLKQQSEGGDNQCLFQQDGNPSKWAKKYGNPAGPSCSSSHSAADNGDYNQNEYDDNHDDDDDDDHQDDDDYGNDNQDEDEGAANVTDCDEDVDDDYEPSFSNNSEPNQQQVVAGKGKKKGKKGKINRNSKEYEDMRQHILLKVRQETGFSVSQLKKQKREEKRAKNRERKYRKRMKDQELERRIKETGLSRTIVEKQMQKESQEVDLARQMRNESKPKSIVSSGLNMHELTMTALKNKEKQQRKQQRKQQQHQNTREHQMQFFPTDDQVDMIAEHRRLLEQLQHHQRLLLRLQEHGISRIANRYGNPGPDYSSIHSSRYQPY